MKRLTFLITLGTLMTATCFSLEAAEQKSGNVIISEDSRYAVSMTLENPSSNESLRHFKLCDKLSHECVVIGGNANGYTAASIGRALQYQIELKVDERREGASDRYKSFAFYSLMMCAANTLVVGATKSRFAAWGVLVSGSASLLGLVLAAHPKWVPGQFFKLGELSEKEAKTQVIRFYRSPLKFANSLSKALNLIDQGYFHDSELLR